MVECIGSLSWSDARKLTIVDSEPIPLFLILLFLIENELFFEYSTNLIDFLKRSFDAYKKLENFGNPWPTPDTSLTESAIRCLEFLSFVYASSRGGQNPLIGSVHTFVSLISARINRDYSHLLRQIYSDFLTSNRGEFRPDALNSVSTVIFRFITQLPSFDAHFKLDRCDDRAMSWPILQQLKSDIPTIRTNRGRERPPTACGRTLGWLHCSRASCWLVRRPDTIWLHSGNCETFVRIGTATLECIDHWRATVIIFGNLIRARFHLRRCKALVPVIVPVGARLGDAIQQRLKIKLPRNGDGRLLD
jgi:hypothetical protein